MKPHHKPLENPIAQMANWFWDGERGAARENLRDDRQVRGHVVNIANGYAWAAHTLDGGTVTGANAYTEARSKVVAAWMKHLAGTPVLNGYRTAYTHTRDDKFEISPGANVTIRSITAHPNKGRYYGDDAPSIVITTVVEVRTVVAFATDFAHHSCTVCGAEPPPPDTAALWFLTRNHESGRLAFAEAEDCDNDRDRYPVAGWTRIDSKLHCVDCTKAINEAIAAAKKARGKRKK